MATALDQLIARKSSGQTQLDFDPTGRDQPQLVHLPLDRIEPDPRQPRQNMGDLTGLAESIRQHGVICPIVVEPLGPGHYRILTGGRRYAACKRAGLETVPCIVRTVHEHSRLELQLIENLHRKDLHPVEEARALKRLGTEFNLSQRDLAERLGMSPAAVNQSLRILDLDETILARVQTSEHVSKSVLLEMAKEPDLRRQMALLDKAEAGELTVRAARQEKGGGAPAKGRQEGIPAPPAHTTPLPDGVGGSTPIDSPPRSWTEDSPGVPTQRPSPAAASSVGRLHPIPETAPAVITIPLPEATVEIRFREGPATKDHVIAVLHDALMWARDMAKSLQRLS